jgi:hypothetical protein
VDDAATGLLDDRQPLAVVREASAGRVARHRWWKPRQVEEAEVEEAEVVIPGVDFEPYAAADVD